VYCIFSLYFIKYSWYWNVIEIITEGDSEEKRCPGA
jgi:hypothetical protein